LATGAEKYWDEITEVSRGHISGANHHCEGLNMKCREGNLGLDE
jgi:hypothetical protein